MLKRKNKWIGAVLALMMVLVFTTPIFAQDGSDPLDTPEVDEESTKFLDHPIVKLIAEFFADLFKPPVVVEEGPVSEVGGVELNGEDPPPPPPPPPPGDEFPPDDVSAIVETGIDPGETIAALHEEENLGFGEIVKLMEIVEEMCAGVDDCELTLDILLAKREDGIGMGELFEMYGKPEHLGVGQIRKELEPVGQIKNENAFVKEEKTNNGKAKGKDK